MDLSGAHGGEGPADGPAFPQPDGDHEDAVMGEHDAPHDVGLQQADILPVPEKFYDQVDADVFKRATMSSISEVASYLRQESDKLAKNGAIPHTDLLQVLDYCTKFAPSKSDHAEKQIRRTVEGLIPQPYLVSQVLNLGPESAEELMHLIPELAPGEASSPFKSEEEIQALLNEIEAVRNADI